MGFITKSICVINGTGNKRMNSIQISAQFHGSEIGEVANGEASRLDLLTSTKNHPTRFC